MSFFRYWAKKAARLVPDKFVDWSAEKAIFHIIDGELERNKLKKVIMIKEINAKIREGTVAISLDLKGEKELIKVIAHGITVDRNDDETAVCVDSVEISRPWLNVLAQQFGGFPSKFTVPSQFATIVESILKDA